jgi:hypothetical protein
MELIQSNTDGLFMKVDSMETAEKVKSIAHEWEQRTRLNLEWDIYCKIFQKDVNNYIIINKDDKYKSKGAYVKKLSNIDYDLPIVNKALINYFVKNKPIKDTINECNDLREFQKIVKVSSLYKYALYGDEKLPEKVLRVFASTKEDAKGVFKVKTEDRIEKIGNTPEKCFIYNDSVIDVKIPDYLDKNYYIEVAEKRLSDFFNAKVKTNSKMSSGIKGINADLKDEVVTFYENSDYTNFIDFLVALQDNTSINKTQIANLIKLNYFNDFGENKKLLIVYEKYCEKYKKTYVDKIKAIKINELKERI